MDPIKEAFARAKADVDSLRTQVEVLVSQVQELKQVLTEFQHNLSIQQTNKPLIPTHNLTELNKTPPEAVKSQYNEISSGNEGVPTNQPTNQQTNQRTGNEGVSPHTIPDNSSEARVNRLSKVAELLASLDELKKEVRIKFKRLTEQEMAVFSAIYLLEEKGFIVDYPLLADHLKLSEISIRDYIRKIGAKGIPVDKIKLNSKKVSLSVNTSLKRIASLETILQLRAI